MSTPDMGSVSMRLVESADDFENALAVRLRVFVQEQSVPIEEEVDDQDNEAVHAIAELKGIIVATGRLILQQFPIVYIGRMAVDIDHRRHGIGGKLLIFLEPLLISPDQKSPKPLSMVGQTLQLAHCLL